MEKILTVILMSELVFGTVAWAEEHGRSKDKASDETHAQAEKGQAQDK